MTRWKPDAAGRLATAAMDLFTEQGYEATTVAEIAQRAGLTKRTFFRHFADKREVLFSGVEEMRRRWLDAVTAAPAEAGPLEAVAAGFVPVAEMFEEHHSFTRVRTEIIHANPELQERELIKLQRLAEAITETLEARGTSHYEAVLAAQAGVTVFHVGFARWVVQNDAAALPGLLRASMDELRSVTAA